MTEPATFTTWPFTENAGSPALVPPSRALTTGTSSFLTGPAVRDGLSIPVYVPLSYGGSRGQGVLSSPVPVSFAAQTHSKY